jgi:Fe-S-cluster containining protein
MLQEKHKMDRFRKKTRLLEKMYRFYDGLTRSFSPWKCKSGCSCCCTPLAILTSLEAAYLWERKRDILIKRIDAFGELIVPPLAYTTNEQAALSLAEIDFVQDAQEKTMRRCPLLDNDRCSCYDARPLMCRMMLSSVDCASTGCAEFPSELLSLHTALLQIVEDLDKEGCSGYLVHLAPHFQDPLFASAYAAGKTVLEDNRLRPNRRNPGLLVPPEHQVQVRRWMEDLTVSKVIEKI